MNPKEIPEDPHKKLTKNSFQLSVMQNTVEASFSLGKVTEQIKLNSNTITDDNESFMEDEAQLRKKPNLCPSRECYATTYKQNNSNLTPNEMECFNLFSNKSCRSIITDSGQTCHDIKFNNGRWSTEEHQKFIEAMFLYGNEWKKVQNHINSRSSTQARSHAQKFFIRLRKIFVNEEDDNNQNNLGNMMSNSTKHNENKRNEKILNWIKESLNLDVIVKLLQYSGNDSSEENVNFFSAEDELYNDAMSYYSGCQYLGNSPKLSEKENFAIKNSNSNLGCNSASKKPDRVKNNINVPSQRLEQQAVKEAFINEKKEKLCKIIIDLINNPSRIKKNPSKHSHSHSLSHSIMMKDSLNVSASEKFHIITNRGVDCKNEMYNGGLNSDFFIKQDNNNINNNEIMASGNISQLIHDSNIAKNLEASMSKLKQEKENFELTNDIVRTQLQVNQSDMLMKDGGINTRINDFNRINNINNLYNTNNSTYAYMPVDNSKSANKIKKIPELNVDYNNDSNHYNNYSNTKTFTPPENFRQKNGLIEGNQFIPNTSNNLSNNTYYNPNMNSYINIVTINLGCKDEVKNDDKPYLYNFNNNKGDDNSVNTNNYVNNQSDMNVNNIQGDDENIKKILSKKLMMIEYQKFMKNKATMPNIPNQFQNNMNPSNINVITNSNHLNITNGECNIINAANEKEHDKELNLISDPFKISFDESFSTFNNPHQHLIEENDINKLNLDLDHFFHMDNL